MIEESYWIARGRALEAIHDDVKARAKAHEGMKEVLKEWGYKMMAYLGPRAVGFLDKSDELPKYLRRGKGVDWDWALPNKRTKIGKQISKALEEKCRYPSRFEFAIRLSDPICEEGKVYYPGYEKLLGTYYIRWYGDGGPPDSFKVEKSAYWLAKESQEKADQVAKEAKEQDGT